MGPAGVTLSAAGESDGLGGAGRSAADPHGIGEPWGWLAKLGTGIACSRRGLVFGSGSVA
jgi:hypothetical protein